MPKVIFDNEIHIESASNELLEWARQNYTIANPEYAKKRRMGFWTGNTPKTLSLYKTDGDTLILPYGVWEKLAYNYKTDVELKATTKEVNYRAKEINLYPYQKEAVCTLMAANGGILQAPAGCGKTQIGIALAVASKQKALWLTHTKDLLQQSKERAMQYMPDEVIGTVTEGKVNIGSAITFATVQTMARLNLEEYKRTFGLVIVDECHRVAGSPTALTMFYKVINSLSCLHKYGLSATVHRADGMIKATYALLGDCVHEISQEEVGDMIMPVRIVPVGTNTKISEQCLNTDGTINYQKLITYLCEDEKRNQIIANNIQLEEDKSSLVLSERINHLESILACLPRRMQEKAVMISGKMTSKKAKAEREAALEQMRTGEKQYLFATYQLAKEGLDIPRLSRLYLATPQKDYAVITQSVGRVARKCEGKEDAVVYDFVDCMSYAQRAFKKRCTSYNKLNTYMKER